MADIRCQMCGKPNPDHLEECQHCGARIKPLFGSSSNASFEQDDSGANWADASQEDTLGWLRSLGQEEAGEGELYESPEENDFPDWLSDPDEKEDIPDWMKQTREENPFVNTGSLPEQNLRKTPETEFEPNTWAPSEKDAPLSKGDDLDEFFAGSTPATSFEPENDLPSWLNEAEGDVEASPVMGDDWLQSLGSDEDMVQTISMDNWPSSSPEPPTQPIKDNDFGDLPSWLSGSSGPSDSRTEPATNDEQEGEFTDWLSSLSSGTGSTGKLGDLPHWLEREDSVPAGSTVPSSFEETDWLATLGDEPELDTEVDHVEAASSSKLDKGLGGFSGGFGTIGGLTIDDEDSIAGEIKKSDLPDWLSSIRGDRSEVSEPSSAFSDTPMGWGFPSGSEADSKSPVSSSLSEANETQEEISTTGGLPDWVHAFRPMEGAEIASEYVEGTPERVGPLAGLRGVLSAEADIAKSFKSPVYASSLQVSTRQHTNAALLQSLVETEGVLAPVPGAPPLTTQKVVRVAMGVILILAILLPLFSGTQMIPSPTSLPPEMQIIQNHVSIANANTSVLLAFDYAPALSGELDMAAIALVDHLMDREVRLILVSTSPIGPGLGERHITGLQSKFPYAHRYEYGQDYVNLGYIPGGAIGLKAFATAPRQTLRVGYDSQPIWGMIDLDASNPWLTPVLQNIVSLQDIAFTIVLTDDPDTARNWVEQVGPALRNQSLMMMVSTQAEPFVRPYYQENNPVDSQIAGLMIGLRDGVAYEADLGEPGLARLVWDAFGIGIIAALSLILAGGAYNYFSLLSSDQKKRKRAR